ncbi:hypothetical protein IVB08_34360 [Bradyrhizobium sp. 173]|uniref:hypothetical protein n=1 Tax=Bradyrhizobium sp. 173 TaxID=2782644 RepID=UPI001FFBC915|nr:hypothetical protein [Bradyrhizobium sp. 173]MCK1568944.1 hypothetical protein [Bradyrhizobium sp. 173]
MSIIESCTFPPVRPRRTLRTVVRRKFERENLSKFGRVCAELWPDQKIDVILAQRIGCSERAAQFYISGGREPSYEALMVVLDELRPRKRA